MKNFTHAFFTTKSKTIKLVFAMLAMFFLNTQFSWSQATYYSKTAGTFSTLSNWSLTADGTGAAPGSIGTNNTWIIQSGHAMTVAANLTVGTAATSIIRITGAGSLTTSSTATLTALTMQIENGTWTNSSSGTVTLTNFNIWGSGTYINNTATASTTVGFPGTTKRWADATNSNNGNGTVEIRNHGTSGLALVGVVWGNVRLNITGGLTAPTGNSGSFADVRGNFICDATNGFDYRLNNAQTATHTIGGNLVVNGGSLNLKSGAGAIVFNIGGNLTVAGGTLTQTTGTSTINFTGANGTYTFSSGTFTTTLMNFDVNSGAKLTLASGLIVGASRTLTVNGTLDVVTRTVTSAGATAAFTVASTGILATSNTSGIEASIPSTNMTRTFTAGASYVFNGASTTAFPTTAQQASIGNPKDITTTVAISLNRPITMSGILTLGGVLTSSSTNTLTLTRTTNDAITGGGTSSFINGPVTWTLSSTPSANYTIP